MGGKIQKKHITNSAEQTKKLGKEIAKEFLKNNLLKKLTIIGLRGDLGSGKTTFLQGFAKGLGIKEKILSPTFVIIKRFGKFYHIDCYRIKDYKDILALGFKEIVKNPKNIVAIEWPEKIKKILPQNIIFIDFKFIDKNTREISFKM